MLIHFYWSLQEVLTCTYMYIMHACIYLTSIPAASHISITLPLIFISIVRMYIEVHVGEKLLLLLIARHYPAVANSVTS